jgi:hypothetical protein
MPIEGVVREESIEIDDGQPREPLGDGMKQSSEETINSSRRTPWKGFARFQLPLLPFSKLLRDRSTGAVELYSALFAVASGQGLLIAPSPYRKELIIKVSHQVLENRVGISSSSITRATRKLVAMGLVKSKQGRTKGRKKIAVSSYVLLDPGTHDPMLKCHKYGGVCFVNDVKPFMTLPKAYLSPSGPFKSLSKVARRTLFAALMMASERGSLRLYVRQVKWQERSGVKSRSHFSDAIDELELQGLLHYGDGLLEVYDPMLREPVPRWRRRQGEELQQRINEAMVLKGKRRYPIDYETVTPEQWQAIVEEVMRRRFVVKGSGWTTAIECPFVTHRKPYFSINFHLGCYRCYKCADGMDHGKGKLARLIRLLLKCNVREVHEIIARHCNLTLVSRDGEVLQEQERAKLAELLAAYRPDAGTVESTPPPIDPYAEL